MGNKVYVFSFTCLSMFITTVTVLAGFNIGWHLETPTMQYFWTGVLLGIIDTLFWISTIWFVINKD